MKSENEINTELRYWEDRFGELKAASIELENRDDRTDTIGKFQEAGDNAAAQAQAIAKVMALRWVLGVGSYEVERQSELMERVYQEHKLAYERGTVENCYTREQVYDIFSGVLYGTC